MSLKIIPYPTAKGQSRAIEANAGGISLQTKFIEVGEGLQDITLDNAGRAITDKLAKSVGYLEILTAKKVNPYQWQLVIDLRSIQDEEWNFSEFALCDAEKDVIAIYGNKTQALQTITPFLNNALLAINLLLATFPADSIVIEHHNLPLHLFFDNEFKAFHLATTGNMTDILRLNNEMKNKASSAEFGIVSAFQNLTLNAFNQQTMQAGILSARQYNYHGNVDSMRRVWDRGYNPAGSHNHPNYDRMSGNAEVTCITPTGDFIQMRHSDYRHKQAIQHDDFLKTEDVPLPTVPASVLNQDTVDTQIQAMRALYQQYESGQFPAGFKFVLVIIETWVEAFTGDVSETFDSFRHQVQINKAVDQYRLNKVYADTGLKDRFENLPINKVFVAGLKDDGTPILGVLKGRFICKDLEEHGDLRPYINGVDDPVMDVYREISNERFNVAEAYNRPSKLDEIMATVSGLDGHGAYLEEVHKRYGNTETIADWGTNKTQNAANYHRWGAQLDDDASNRRNYQAGFNTPNFWKALTSRSEVLPSTFGDRQYSTSWAMPYELILYHPVMNWNPYDLPRLNARPANADDGGTTEATAFQGIYKNAAWYLTPPEFYTNNSISDLADTGAGVRYVKDRKGIARRVRASGIYIQLPEIKDVGKIRQRYPIYHRPQDGSYETALAQAYHVRNLKMTDKLSAEITNILADQINKIGETV